MQELTILDENKKYDCQETKILLGEVRDFFQKELKIVVPEWISEQQEVFNTSEDRVINVFYIDKNKEPLYSSCNGYDDLKKILDLFEQRLNNLLDNLDEILGRNNHLDDNSRESLKSYAGAVDKCIAVFGNQRKKRAAKFKEASTVEELRDELQQFFAEIISNYIIVVLFDALYERMKNQSGQVYEMVTKEINNFLSENGVYTKKVCIGEVIDPEYMEPTLDSKENITDDFKKFDTIDEIRRYPYMFSDDKKIVDGCAKIWRKRD